MVERTPPLSIIKQFFVQAFKMEMDLEMIRFRISSNGQAPIQYIFKLITSSPSITELELIPFKLNSLEIQTVIKRFIRNTKDNTISYERFL